MCNVYVLADKEWVSETMSQHDSWVTGTSNMLFSFSVSFFFFWLDAFNLACRPSSLPARMVFGVLFRRSGRSYGNATQTIANERERSYAIVPIVQIELNSIQAIEVVSVFRVVCDRLGSVSIWSFRSSEHFFETTGTIRTIGTIMRVLNFFHLSEVTILTQHFHNF